MSDIIEILLVEDNPGDIRLTQEAFKEGNLNTNLNAVTDGDRALDYLYRRGEYVDALRPELILLDLNLPKKDGREVLELIKRDPDLKTIPIIILTTSSSDFDINRCYDLLANCFITKPIDFDSFMEVILAIESYWLKLASLPSRK